MYLLRQIPIRSSQAEEYLHGEEKLREYITPFSPVWEQFQLAEDFNPLLEDIKITILDYFQPENDDERKELSQLFEKNKSWISLTRGRSMAGFHLSRVICIIAGANMCGYLEESKTEELLNYYGSFTEALFDNWETFLASAVFGKQLMSANSGTFILDSSDYVESCYKLAAHEGKLLEVSGLWADSDMTESGPYYDMEALLKKKRFEQSPDEIAFIAHSKLLVTDQSIRVMEKKLFGSKIHTFPWTQKLQFSYDFTKLDLIAFKVNGITMFHMPRNYKKAGISKKDDVFLDKDQVLKHYSEDINNALLAFSELNQVLGGIR